MNDFARVAEQVGTLAVVQSDAQALTDVKHRAGDHTNARAGSPKLRLALFAVASPALLAAVTVGTLLVRNSVHPAAPNQHHFALGGVAPSVPSNSPTPVSQVVPSASPAVSVQASPGSSPGGSATPPSPSPPAPPPIASPNLFSNPSFESNTSGWQPYYSTITRVPLTGAPNGSYVAKVTCTSGYDYDIGSVEGIGNPLDIYGKAGKTYTASVWVRAASSKSLGQKLQFHIRERHGGDGDVNNLIDNASPAITLTNNFQQLTISLNDKYDGDYLDIYAMQLGSCTNADSFYADAFVLTAS